MSAKDQASGKQQQIVITASSGLSKGDVERMVKEAEAHAAEDARRREEIEQRNQTDARVYSVQRGLTEQGSKLNDDERRRIQQALDEARAALSGNDTERIKRAHESLTQAANTLAEAASRQPAAASAPSSTGDDVVDAEVVDDSGR